MTPLSGGPGSGTGTGPVAGTGPVTGTGPGGGSPPIFRLVADVVLPCEGSTDVIRDGAVDVADGLITAVGPRPPADGTPEIRVRGALLPGLVNLHCHSPMTLFRGTGADLPLQRWLQDVLWPQEANLTEEDVFWGMSLAAAELLRFGVTTTCEAYFHEDALADAALAAGMRPVVTPGLLDLGPPGDGGASTFWADRIAEVADFHARRHGEDGRLEVGFAPHAPYTVPLPVLSDVAAEAERLGALVHLHLAETEAECRAYEAEHGGRSTPRVLADAGVFRGRTLAAHCVWLSDDDLDCLVEHDVAVAHCPQSNAKLASGIARLPDLLDRDLRVGVGTDGPASNNDLDLWEEVRLAAALARLQRRDAAAMDAPTAFSLATGRAGRALGRPELGVLAPGTPADVVALDLDDAAFVPVLDDAQFLEHLVWSAASRHVTDVWVAGRRVVEDRRCLTVDEERARREVQGRAARLAASLR